MSASFSLAPLQAGSCDMSILAGFGAVPSYFTVPLSEPTVAGSMGVAAGAGAAEGEVDCSVFSFLLQAASNNKPARASRRRNANREFFMMGTFLVVLDGTSKTYYSNANLRRTRPNCGPPDA